MTAGAVSNAVDLGAVAPGLNANNEQACRSLCQTPTAAIVNMLGVQVNLPAALQTFINTNGLICVCYRFDNANAMCHLQHAQLQDACTSITLSALATAGESVMVTLDCRKYI